MIIVWVDGILYCCNTETALYNTVKTCIKIFSFLASIRRLSTQLVFFHSTTILLLMNKDTFVQDV